MPPPGYARSPFQEGFSALREEPLLLVAELTWRWCFALASWIIVLFAAVLFLDGLKVDALDRFLLATMQPALERTALIHVFHGALLRIVWIKFIVLAAVTVLWAFAAAVGHAASLRNLIPLAGGEDHDEDAGWQFHPMFQLHLLRALWTWIALGCAIASLFLGHRILQASHPARGAFFYVFGFSLSIVFGVILNWMFGLAPLFCIRHQVNARNAVALTLDFCTRQGERLFGLSLAFLALRVFWAASMFFVVLAPTGLGKNVAVGWELLMMSGLFLIYLVGADALHIAQLGAYASLADIDAQPAPEPPPLAPTPQPWTPYIPPPDTTGAQLI
jgi:hypothetical protein